MTARISTIIRICWLSISVSMISSFSPTSLLKNNIRLSQQLFHLKITNDDRRTFLTSSSLFHHKITNYDRRTFLTSSSLVASTIISSSASISNAITPEQASKSYDTYASTYDYLDGGSMASSLGIDEARQDLLSKATGNVLEIGVGTGLNLNSYNYNNIKSLTLVDISIGMIEEAKLRIQNEIVTKDAVIKFVIADATSELTSLFGEETFDTVVDTFSLCVMGNEGAKRCLDQMTSVVKKKTGRILLIENTRSSNPVLGAYQDITASAAAQIGGKGCLYNQDVGKMIRETKELQLVKEEAFAGGVFRSFICQHV